MAGQRIAFASFCGFVLIQSSLQQRAFASQFAPQQKPVLSMEALAMDALALTGSGKAVCCIGRATPATSNDEVAGTRDMISGSRDFAA